MCVCVFLHMIAHTCGLDFPRQINMTYLEVHALNVETLLENPRWNNIYLYMYMYIKSISGHTAHSFTAGTRLTNS